MKTFEAGKTVTQLGIDTARKFFVCHDNPSGSDYRRGDVLSFVRDDGDTAPKFRRDSDGLEQYVSLSALCYATDDLTLLPEGSWLERDGTRYEVLMACGQVRVLGLEVEMNGKKYTKASDNFTVSELAAHGFKPVSPKEEAVEVTMDEVEAKFGKKVKIKNVENK